MIEMIGDIQRYM